MADRENALDERWLGVIGRSLAFLCLHHADLRDRDIGEQAELLDALGLSGREIAALLGSTEGSVRELLRVRRKKSEKGGANGKKRDANKKGKQRR